MGSEGKLEPRSQTTVSHKSSILLRACLTEEPAPAELFPVPNAHASPKEQPFHH